MSTLQQTKNMETWLIINGYTHHEVSSLGRVRRTEGYRTPKQNRYRKACLIKQTPDTGYMLVVLPHGLRARVHRLVAKAFLPNPENKTEVNHINGNKSDNRAENLEWCTHSENIQHAYDTNLIASPCKGERHSKTTLVAEQVLVIRELYANGEKVSAIASRIGISYMNVWSIVTGRTWKHILP